MATPTGTTRKTPRKATSPKQAPKAKAPVKEQAPKDEQKVTTHTCVTRPGMSGDF